MAINLKQISTSDSDNIKLDKVNYNFDQLVANGGGPRGITGPKGDTGFQGVAGPQGPQGIVGPQGFQGPAGSNQESYWIRKNGDTGSLTTDTLFPAVSTGALNSPVISIGFLSTDIEYNNYQPLNSGESPYQWIINRKNHFASNLRFKSSDVLDNNFDFKIYHDTILNKTTFRMAFTDQTTTPTRLIWEAENHIFKSNISGGDLLLINETNITFYKDIHHNSPLTINNDLYIEGANANINKVATSVNSSGLIEFKDITELGGIVPYGTITSMLPSVFSNNANFINNETIDLNASPNTINDVLKIRVGAGVGDYEGWYLCNGKEWIDDSVPTTHLVPDLNSFSYIIEDNPLSNLPTSQGAAIITNNDINIIGGSNIGMDANISEPGVYNITSSVQTTDVNIDTSTGGTSFKIKKLPQIIYLINPNLYWKDMGENQAPISNVTYVLDDIGIENIPNISEIVSISEGSSSIESMDIEAPTGYTWNDTPIFTYSSPISNVTTSLISATTLQVTYTISAQPTDGTIVTITYNSNGFLDVIPLFDLTISRTGSISPYYIISPSTPNIVQYNINTGYTFDIILTTINSEDYTFSNTNVALINTLPGNAIYTVNNTSFTGGVNPNTQITVNVTITGLSISDTSSSYELSVDEPVYSGGPIEFSPQIGDYPFIDGNQIGNEVQGIIQNPSNITYYVKLGGFITYGNSIELVTGTNIQNAQFLSLTGSTSYTTGYFTFEPLTSELAFIGISSGGPSDINAHFYYSTDPFAPEGSWIPF